MFHHRQSLLGVIIIFFLLSLFYQVKLLICAYRVQLQWLFLWSLRRRAHKHGRQLNCPERSVFHKRKLATRCWGGNGFLKTEAHSGHGWVLSVPQDIKHKCDDCISCWCCSIPVERDLPFLFFRAFLEVFTFFVHVDVMVFCLAEVSDVWGGGFLEGGCIKRTCVQFLTWFSNL